MPDTPAATDTPRTTLVQLMETHGDSDEAVREWHGSHIVVSRAKVQIDGATVALFEDNHYYPTLNPRAPSVDDLADDCGNEVWIEAAATPQVQADPPAEGLLPVRPRGKHEIEAAGGWVVACGAYGEYGCMPTEVRDYIVQVLNAATPVAKPEGAGLDVDRLAKAIHEQVMMPGHAYPDAPWKDACAETAEQLAAAYAEAASPRSDAGSEG